MRGVPGAALRRLDELLHGGVKAFGVPRHHTVKGAWVLGDVNIYGTDCKNARVVCPPASLKARVEGVRRADRDTDHSPDRMRDRNQYRQPKSHK